MNQKEIAQRLGISHATVSLALSGSAKVNDKTRQQVLAFARDVGYRPNFAARSLQGKRSNYAGVIFPEFTNAFYGQLTANLHIRLRACGYTGIFHTALTDDEIENAVDEMISRGVDFVIACSFKMEKLLPLYNAGIPVYIYRNNLGLPFSSVDVNRIEGGKLAGRHLIDTGHRRLAYLGFTADGREERFVGFKAALAEHSIDLPELSIVYCYDNMEAGYAAMKELLGRVPETDGVFCFNDSIAIGALRAAFELGRKVGEDLGVVGFDNIKEGAFIVPALTTIHQPSEQIATELVMLAANAEKNSLALKNVVLMPSLVIRESCGGYTTDNK